MGVPNIEKEYTVGGLYLGPLLCTVILLHVCATWKSLHKSHDGLLLVLVRNPNKP